MVFITSSPGQLQCPGGGTPDHCVNGAPHTAHVCHFPPAGTRPIPGSPAILVRVCPVLSSILNSSSRAGVKSSLKEAYDHTCAKKPNIMPNTGFFKQLLVCCHAFALQLPGQVARALVPLLLAAQASSRPWSLLCTGCSLLVAGHCSSCQ